ncbi:MAG TPA: peroxiredoxin-like family protein [Candidatus Deferrimicrobium sp.]|nr:peroxiredoxin-like family protein [Candidatus Deferrimicrobium sp.]
MSDRIDELTRAAEDRWKAGWQAGPSRLRWTTLPLQVGDPAPDAVLPDHEGRPRRLSAFWSERPVLLLFWRHFGCSCGMDRAGRLRAELAGYRSSGGEVVIVGQSEPERAARYRELQELDVLILSDPERTTYAAFGLLQGTPAQILFDAPDPFLRCDYDAGMELAASRHGTPRAMVDDPWQLPGEFVVGADGVVGHAHRYGWCEDYPDPRVHVAAIREAAGLL